MNAATADGLSRADLERFFLKPYGLRFEELAGLPAPCGAHWACADLLPWLQGFFRGVAPTAPSFGECIALEEHWRPNASPEELLERATDRFVDLAVARVVMKRLP